MVPTLHQGSRYKIKMIDINEGVKLMSIPPLE